MATPTFLLSYLRRCTKEQFSTLRYVITGAEKLKRNLAESFDERFGIEPLEGYGCSELSPVAMLNIPDFEGAAGKQVGNKAGSVGHPIPGVSARIVDPETFEMRQPEQDGLLLVKGPNVMLGYLGNPEKTAEAVRDGWYVTGDIATMDPDGFITITDRLSRFSKIGGEMVPHVKLEEEIHQVLSRVEQVCVVTAVPDERKGERLVVLCTIEVDAAQVTKGLSERGLPNLWIPKREHFYRIESIPQLGSGKLDLRTVKRLAQEMTQGSNL
jgi:acyl-[acyl-carrier-protein]-phospholipid O-acyltransferase/long-chain-fatty-acid--[acyl-carrier-protein] ligase